MDGYVNTEFPISCMRLQTSSTLLHITDTISWPMLLRICKIRKGACRVEVLGAFGASQYGKAHDSTVIERMIGAE